MEPVKFNSSIVNTAIIIAVIVVAIFFITSGPVYFTGFLTANDTVILDINVSTTAQIRVLPLSINWSMLDPGTNGSVMNVSVKNAGSINVTDIYTTVDTLVKEDINPLPIGNSSYYASGGLIFIRNETGTYYWHLGRLEWNLSDILSGEDLDLESYTIKFAHGWYRRATGNEYLWKVENGTDEACNNTNTIMKIKRDPENASGYNRDLSSNVATGSALNSNENWTFFTFSDGPLIEHCAASYHDCTKIYIYKFDKSSEFTNCADSIFLTQENLTPGERLDKLRLKASIPEGFPGGDTKTGILTIVASSS